MAVTGEDIAQGGLLATLAGLAIAWIRQQMAKSKQEEAGASTATANTGATSVLFEHYRKELADLRTTVNNLGDRLSNTEAELAKVEALYAASAAGERRYRQAFSVLLQEHSRLMAIARPIIPAVELAQIEQRVTHLMMDLAKPLDDVEADAGSSEERA